MDDVTVPNTVNNQVETENVSPAPESVEGENIVAPSVDVEKMQSELQNLQKALKAEREARRNERREIAKKAQVPANPEDYEQWVNHPMSRELLVKVARQELTDFTREVFQDTKYQGIPEVVKKAILSNVRGFVNENTTDVEMAKVDILDYIDGLLEETQAAAPTSKPFPVPAPNGGSNQGKSGTPAQIAELINKPMDELTEDEGLIIESYRKGLKKS